MAEHMDFDPAKIPAPNFAGKTYAFVRSALISDANTPEVTTDELAAQRLKDQWEIHIEGLKIQYQAQLRQEEILREQRRQEEAEAEKLVEAERQEKEKELSKEAEKKRLPIYSFQKGLGVDAVPLQLHPYAKKMMTARKYVPLWYFLPDAAVEAKERTKESLDTNHLQFAVEDAKSAFLNALGLGTWPDEFVAMFAGFYSNMDMHRELQEQDGDRVLAHYHAKMWLAWYDAIERKEPFDLSIISDRVIGESRQQIVKQKQEKSLKGYANDSVSLPQQLLKPPTTTFATPTHRTNSNANADFHQYRR
ncbi:hypothetical protein EV359DRAFT_64058 [Lentinula novae-zelandiae]|nr:hypothetical protein EV359DRAFT_64058 [Lentinula novae-zelandiae]